MQVFIIGSPLETAVALDKKRLNKQIIECQQILDALNGAKAWRNHPAVLQYRGHEKWLEMYMRTLHYYDRGIGLQLIANEEALKLTPSFHVQEYFDQMKRRLYTKDPEHYKQWEHLGKSEVNYYWSEVENKFIKYKNGKRIE